VTVRKLDGCDHLPIRNGVETAEAISPQYANTTRDWINAHLA